MRKKYAIWVGAIRTGAVTIPESFLNYVPPRSLGEQRETQVPFFSSSSSKYSNGRVLQESKF